jgi:hypothetical protein
MEDKDREIFEHMNQTFDQMLKVMEKPESKILIALQYGTGAVGILGIFAIIDIIIRWIIGG